MWNFAYETYGIRIRVWQVVHPSTQIWYSTENYPSSLLLVMHFEKFILFKYVS